MQISVKELLDKNKKNPSKITQLSTQIKELKELVSQLQVQLEQMRQDIEILKEGDNI